MTYFPVKPSIILPGTEFVEYHPRTKKFHCGYHGTVITPTEIARDDMPLTQFACPECLEAEQDALILDAKVIVKGDKAFCSTPGCEHHAELKCPVCGKDICLSCASDSYENICCMCLARGEIDLDLEDYELNEDVVSTAEEDEPILTMLYEEET